MALPTITSPKYKLTIPSQNKEIAFRPFLVKEEKILLMALESEDESAMEIAIKDIVESCTFNEINIYQLTTYDIEYIFLQISAKSTGEVSNLTLICTSCQQANEVPVRIDDVKVEFKDNHNNRIDIETGIGLVLKAPNASLKLTSKTSTEKMFETIKKCIDFIYDSEQIYKINDVSEEELDEFINSIPDFAFKKIQEFFNTLPTLKKVVEFECEKCNEKNKHVIEGMASFLE